MNIDDRPTLAPAVSALLGSLRRRIRQYVWLEGCAAATAWLGVAFWATLAADWFFEPPAVVRGIMLVAVAAVLAAVVARMIGRRAFVRITDGNAATILERRFSQLNDALLTSVVLLERRKNNAASTNAPNAPATAVAGRFDDVDRLTFDQVRTTEDTDLNRQMLAHTCREAAARVADVDLKKVFNPRPLRLHGIAAALLVVSVAFFATLFPEAFGVWARRALALSNELWPRSTRLLVDGFADGMRKVARGSDLVVVAKADTLMPWVPQTVEVRYRTTEGGGRGRATMDRRGVRGAEDRFQEYAYTFRSVLTDISFDVVGGDDRVRDLWIQVVDSPSISQMTLDCQLPEYIGREQQPPLPATGVMQIPMGSRVTVRAAKANKDIVRVQVDSIVEDRPGPQKVLEADELTADHRGFSHALPPLMKEITLLFTLTDTDNVRSREPVRLALVPTPDQPPQLAVQLFGIGTAITPQARLPAVGKITDDYGIDRVWFEYAVDQQKPDTHPIAEPTEAPGAFNLVDVALEVSKLGLKPGQKFLLCVKAADLCDLGQGPNVAASERWLLDVVTPEQLQMMLDLRELVLRQRFERMIQEMTETRDLLARLTFSFPLPKGEEETNKPGEDEPDDSPERQRTLRFLRVEGALTNCRKSIQEVLGLAEAFDDIREQLTNNRIDTEESKIRLREGIAEPLRGIAEKMLPELERRLEALTGVLDKRQEQEGPAARDHAEEQAEEILLAMRKILDRMIKMGDFKEAIEWLRNIIEMQKQLYEQTKQQHKKNALKLLEE